MNIRASIESARGCGYRQVGGLYLMGGGSMISCGRLPQALVICPTCSHGIKPTRGWTWIEPGPLFGIEVDGYLRRDVGPKFGVFVDCGEDHCRTCPAGGALPERAGLLWIGGQFYPTPADFHREANSVGVSRRITAIPKDLVIGETWVFVAHREAIARRCSTCDGLGVIRCSAEMWEAHGYEFEDVETTLLASGEAVLDCEDCRDGMRFEPAIFSAFIPTGIEQVVAEDCSEEEADKLRERGIEPVIVKRADEDVELPIDEE